jgi:16S rRNA G966 N2-methylase RsmD
MKEQEFIKLHLNKKVTEIALLLNKRSDLNKDYIINQINGLQKARIKLPQFYKNSNVVYPATISIEQCSSEKSAIYKSKIINSNLLVDLTGGYGVDSFYFSKKNKKVTYIEPNASLFNTVSNNFKILNTTNINTINKTAEEFLNSNTENFDLAYIDPSRRNENQKVFMLVDCIPNIVDLQHEIFKIASKILIKTSPILDIKQSIKELKTVKEIWVVSINNECKEVLYLIDKKYNAEITINTINLGNKDQEFSFTFNTEENALIECSEPLSYFYEPNASILKAGAFKSICNAFDIKKIAKHTHLYTSKDLIENFPGRIFKIEQTLAYQAKTFKKLSIKKANVSCRNFKESVEQVKNKLNIKDGGEVYVFATTNNLGKPILVVSSKA